ncbi:ATP-binding protein [Streptomyces sp. R39]|uniref:ATP-binding protein n=1 Tax=Streptomyces sp. R39 TaxID=3238631 RepID=A0AB39QWC6_9ACTN
MDPINPGPEGYGHDDGGASRSSLFETGGGSTPRQRPPRESLTTDFGQSVTAAARVTRLVSGEFLLTVNPVDGSEIEPCPPTERPARPEKRTAAERADYERAARPPVPAGPARPELPLLERQDDRERLVRLLARGRSVRLTGPAGSGRTALLDLVADDCSDLAPDGVVRLDGFHRTPDDLLRDLFHAVYKAPAHRPVHDELLELVRDIGAVVVIDDIEFGGAGLDELIDATPECAFLIGATPDVPAPSADSAVEEVFLSGLERAGGVDILERAVGRVLTEEEANWAGDLWFESEGLPLRFVQAGALLRQRDQLRASTGAVDEFGVFAAGLSDLAGLSGPSDLPAEASFDTEAAEASPLPSLGEAAAAAPLLASRLSASARATLRFAVALGGEVPHQAHLPALIGDTHADAALGELAGCGLVSPVGSRYRLAAGVLQQLEAAGYADGATAQALTAAQHYSWWAGHPSVTPERVCAEADAVLAALTAVVPATVPPKEDEESTPVRLARTAAPAFAAGLRWSAWERALRAGAEAARLSGEVGDQAYFHHELGILALCGDQLDRARAELEASLGLRGALSDKRGTTAGRRALALVADRSGDALPALAATAGDETTDARHEGFMPQAGGGTTPFPAVHSPVLDTIVTPRVPAEPAPAQGGGLVRMARRNLVGVGAGVLLTAVLGTVVGLGMTSHDNADNPSDNVSVNPSASEGTGDGSLGADPGQTSGAGDTGTATSKPTDPGPDGTLGTSDDPSAPSDTPTPSASATGTKGSSGGGKTSSTPTSPATSKPASPSSSGSATSTPSGGSSSTGTPTGGSSSSSSGPSSSATPSAATNSASGPASNSPSVTTSSASQSSDGGASTGTLI